MNASERERIDKLEAMRNPKNNMIIDLAIQNGKTAEDVRTLTFLFQTQHQAIKNNGPYGIADKGGQQFWSPNLASVVNALPTDVPQTDEERTEQLAIEIAAYANDIVNARNGKPSGEPRSYSNLRLSPDQQDHADGIVAEINKLRNRG